MDVIERIQRDAAEYIQSRTGIHPRIGVVLGSGLGDFCDKLEHVTSVSFRDLPGFPQTTVEGHCGEFLLGTCCGIPVVALRGRLHYYEGYSQQQITIPTRVMALLGVKTLILTNAAGGVNTGFHPGTLMILRDHINYSGFNPLIGRNQDEFGPRFPDMSDVYDPELCGKITARALEQKLDVVSGTYMMYSGPSYETPAEIRFFRMAGADAVGMSTVPEAIVARHCGMKVFGVSCITNMAAGVLPRKLSHAEVVETAERVKPHFLALLDIAIHCAAEEN